MRDSIRWALILSALVHIAIQAHEAVTTRQWRGRHAGLIRAPGDGRLTGSPSLTGCYVVAVAPLAPPILWPLFALGWWWSGSWLALAALSIASSLSLPATMGWVPIAALSALAGLVVASRAGGLPRWAEFTPRGDSLDSIRLRWRTWQVVARSLPAVLARHPFGRRPLGRDLRRYQAATGVSIHDDHAFQEGLQIVYEYGVFGVAGVVLAGVGVGSLVLHHRGDLFTPALLVWLLTMMGSITLRTWPFPALGTLLILGVWAS